MGYSELAPLNDDDGEAASVASTFDEEELDTRKKRELLKRKRMQRQHLYIQQTAAQRALLARAGTAAQKFSPPETAKIQH